MTFFLITQHPEADFANIDTDSETCWAQFRGSGINIITFKKIIVLKSKEYHV